MQYEIVLKSDRRFMLYLPSSKLSCCCSVPGNVEDYVSGFDDF
jgi:hypothetical protein